MGMKFEQPPRGAKAVGAQTSPPSSRPTGRVWLKNMLPPSAKKPPRTLRSSSSLSPTAEGVRTEDLILGDHPYIYIYMGFAGGIGKTPIGESFSEKEQPTTSPARKRPKCVRTGSPGKERQCIKPSESYCFSRKGCPSTGNTRTNRTRVKPKR